MHRAGSRAISASARGPSLARHLHCAAPTALPRCPTRCRRQTPQPPPRLAWPRLSSSSTAPAPTSPPPSGEPNSESQPPAAPLEDESAPLPARETPPTSAGRRAGRRSGTATRTAPYPPFDLPQWFLDNDVTLDDDWWVQPLSTTLGPEERAALQDELWAEIQRLLKDDDITSSRSPGDVLRDARIYTQRLDRLLGLANDMIVATAYTMPKDAGGLGRLLKLMADNANTAPRNCCLVPADPDKRHVRPLPSMRPSVLMQDKAHRERAAEILLSLTTRSLRAVWQNELILKRLDAGAPSLDCHDFTQALAAELKLATAPRPKNSSSGAQRPIPVLACVDVPGSTFTRAVVDAAATERGADVIHLDAHSLAELVGKYLGQDLYINRGSYAMLGYNVEALRDHRPTSVLDRSPKDDDEVGPFEAASQVGGGSGSDIKTVTIRSLLDEAQPRAEPNRWEELKIGHLLEQILSAPEAKRARELNTSGLRPTVVHVHNIAELNSLDEGALILSKLRAAVDRACLDQGRPIVLVGSASPRLPRQGTLSWLEKTCHACEKLNAHVFPAHQPSHRDLAPGSDASWYRTVIRGTAEGQPWLKQYAQTLKPPSIELPGPAGTDSVYKAVLDLYEKDLCHVNFSNFTRMLQAMVGEQVTISLESQSNLAAVFGAEWGFSPASIDSIYGLATQLISEHGYEKNQVSYSQKVLWELGIARQRRKNATVLGHSDQRTNAKSNSRPEKVSASDSSYNTPQPPPRKQLNLDSYEQQLLAGVVEANNIRTTWDDVVCAPEAKDALQTLTTLVLNRPDAFSYGILARERIQGCMLYGPPGTGKTLMARAVARQGGAAVIEVSAASINDKYLGEGEKRVRALFSLARKLAPAVVFIDEADALLGSRVSSSNRARREILTQFLREWDGLVDSRTFVMVATNRPFDIDDAALRRMPRRVLVDLPLAPQRLRILQVVLAGEALDASVSLDDLARRTDMFSGSDLKNMCVAAAMEAVKDEMAARDAAPDPDAHRFPERRTLTAAHFERALRQVGPSISGDMDSLKAIRKFDEKFGDAQGRTAHKGKGSMGFEVGVPAVQSGDARVRREAVS